MKRGYPVYTKKITAGRQISTHSQKSSKAAPFNSGAVYGGSVETYGPYRQDYIDAIQLKILYQYTAFYSVLQSVFSLFFDFGKDLQ